MCSTVISIAVHNVPQKSPTPRQVRMVAISEPKGVRPRQSVQPTVCKTKNKVRMAMSKLKGVWPRKSVQPTVCKTKIKVRMAVISELKGVRPRKSLPPTVCAKTKSQFIQFNLSVSIDTRQNKLKTAVISSTVCVHCI